MGLFSWNCSSCGLPILHNMKIHKSGLLSKVMVFREGKEPFMGHYGGYGNFFNEKVFDPKKPEIDRLTDKEAFLEDNGLVKMVHHCCYEKRMNFENLPKNKRDDGQGHFWEYCQITDWEAMLEGIRYHRKMKEKANDR